MIAVAMLALVLAGGLSVGLSLVFLVVMIGSWMLENTKWQLPERYELIEAVPRTSTGKFWKLKLRERFPN